MKYILIGTNVENGGLGTMYDEKKGIKAFDTWAEAAKEASRAEGTGIVKDISIFDVETGGC